MSVMGHLLSNKFKSQCLHKVRHKSEGAAQAHIRSLQIRCLGNPEDMHTYFCRFCKHWHVGHLK